MSVAAYRHRLIGLAALAMARPQTVGRRVERILAAAAPSPRPGRCKRISVLAGLALLIAVSAATIAPGAPPAEPQAVSSAAAAPSSGIAAGTAEARLLRRWIGRLTAVPRTVWSESEWPTDVAARMYVAAGSTEEISVAYECNSSHPGLMMRVRLLNAAAPMPDSRDRVTTTITLIANDRANPFRSARTPSIMQFSGRAVTTSLLRRLHGAAGISRAGLSSEIEFVGPVSADSVTALGFHDVLSIVSADGAWQRRMSLTGYLDVLAGMIRKCSLPAGTDL